jgi:phospholipase C
MADRDLLRTTLGRNRVNRRQFLTGAAGVLASGIVAAAPSPAGAALSGRSPLDVLGRRALRCPGSVPFPGLAPGTDTLPEIGHIVVLMLENHSYDNFLGMLGRGPGQRPRGDGFTLIDGVPAATNPYADGATQHAFRMPTTCQLSAHPGQEWQTSHIQYAGGTNNGFVISPSGPVSMGYWTQDDLPYTYGLASTFPIGDRWFSSAMAQTDPNRRFLIAATASGMTDDIGTAVNNVIPDIGLLLPPPGGTIFDTLSEFNIPWRDYTANFPIGSTAELYPLADFANVIGTKSMGDFFADAASGNLPAFSLVDPNYSTQSQEDPQNIVVGEALMAQVVEAIGSSPQWMDTLLVVTWDEHGGYYDHVPPPPAIAPDLIPPQVQLGESMYDGFWRYGFRVPAIVISPYARADHVTSVVHDHTSILAMVQRKWNLPALTYRDANANDLTDFLDLAALGSHRPTFPRLPTFPAPGDTAAALACSTTGPGNIPPPDSVVR